MKPLASAAGCRDEDQFRAIAAALETHGYIVLPRAFPLAIVDGLFLHITELTEASFSPGGIGRSGQYQVNPSVRSDQICWMDPTHPANRAYYDWMEQLRRYLNRELFLGLFEYECHYAYYDVGAFYAKHLDAFKHNPNRIVSTVLYLNPNWKPGDGGELRLFAPQGTEECDRPLMTIRPEYGTLVAFLSEDIPHEVVISHKPRYSIAGWFRINRPKTPVVSVTLREVAKS